MLLSKRRMRRTERKTRSHIGIQHIEKFDLVIKKRSLFAVDQDQKTAVWSLL